MPARTGTFIGPTGYYAQDLASIHPQNNSLVPNSGGAPAPSPTPSPTPTPTPAPSSGGSGGGGLPGFSLPTLPVDPSKPTYSGGPGTSNVVNLYKPPSTSPSTYYGIPPNFETELANALFGQSR